MFHILKVEDFHKYWMTPILRANTRNNDKLIPRGAEISTWLYNHDTVSKYVIIHDLAKGEFHDHLEHLVSCDATYGVTEENIEYALNILK